MSKGKVLVAENDASGIVPLKEFLEKYGYEIVTAGSPGEARAVLDNSWVHLAIVDLRLENDNDERDISGLTLCKETDPVIAKIILTNYPTYEAVRVALGPSLKGLPPVVDLLAKSDGLPALLEAVEKAFANHVRVNPELQIEFGGTSSLAMVSLMRWEPLEHTELILWAEELTDLFRKMFFDHSRINVFPLPHLGQEGTVTVSVSGVAETGLSPQPPVIVKCGIRQVVRGEVENYHKFVSPFVRGTQQQYFAETLHLAGVNYSIVGGSLEEISRFSDFYRDTPRPEEISRVLTHLFNKTAGPWYQGQRRQSDERLDISYLEQLDLAREESREQLDTRINSICAEARSLGMTEIKRDETGIIFRFPDGLVLSCPDPIDFMYSGATVLASPFVSCITHGDLNGDNVLVDQDGRTWLIDFERTGWGPVLRDFAELEGVIRWELVKTRNLAQLYRFEKALLEPSNLDVKIRLGDRMPHDLEKAGKVINELRRLAGDIAGANIWEYYAGLLFYAARAIILGGIASPDRGRPSLVRRAHALLSAALICYRLDNRDRWERWPDQKRGAR